MKHRLGLLAKADRADTSIMLPVGARFRAPSRTVGIISLADAESFVAALTEALPNATFVRFAPSATAAEVDEGLSLGSKKSAGNVLVALGDVACARLHLDLLVAIMDGRPVAKQPPLFRALGAEAALVLSEPRLGVARELARSLEGRP